VFAWSVAENRKLWEIVPAPGKPSIPALAFDDKGRLWGSAASEVFSIDVATQRVTNLWSYGTGNEIIGDIDFDPADGMLYAVLGGGSFSRIDPATGQRFVIKDTPGNWVDVHPDGDVYVSSGLDGTELFRYDMPDGSCKHPDPSATVKVRDADSGVPNRTVTGGCTIEDLFLDEATWPNQVALIFYTIIYANVLQVTGVLDASERDRIIAAAKRATI
jgi:WD40 repeat protein